MGERCYRATQTAFADYSVHKNGIMKVLQILLCDHRKASLACIYLATAI